MGADQPPETDLLVVGAGPTGLTLALQSRLMGARVRIVERRARPRDWAPALAVQPRTMEVLRGLGVAQDLLARGVSEVQLQIHVGQSTVDGSLHDLHLPETEYAFIFFVPQPTVETVLRERLAGQGVEVEWQTEFVELEQEGDHVRCRLRHGGEREEIASARFLAGCDGRESSVRESLGIPFRGRRYRETLLVADAEASPGLTGATAHAFLAGRGIVFFFPLPSGRWRIITGHPADNDEPDLRALIEEHTGGEVRLGALDWMQAITPHHRVASRFGQRQVFLAGDAAHTHSPAGAQGMNTGIQDAANLGWKLALVARGASQDLLHTYEQERRPVARHVVRLTGLAYALEVSDLPWLRLGRRIGARPIARLLLSHPRLMSQVARVVSGLDLRYRRGAIAEPARCSRLARPGTRLRDTRLAGGPPERLHGLLDGSAFHLLVFDEETLERIEESIRPYARVLSTHRIRRSQLPALGLRRRNSGFILVRPDGYVAVSGETEPLSKVDEYLDRWVGRHLAGQTTTSLTKESPSLRATDFSWATSSSNRHEPGLG